jgi:hypothetical protein
MILVIITEALGVISPVQGLLALVVTLVLVDVGKTAEIAISPSMTLSYPADTRRERSHGKS